FEGPFSGVIQRALLSDHAHRHAGIIVAARLLHRPGASDSRTDRRRGFRRRVAAQLLIRNRRNFDVDIDAVQQGPADLPQVLLNLAGRATALARGIAEEPALARVQITTATQYELGVPGRVGRSPG